MKTGSFHMQLSPTSTTESLRHTYTTRTTSVCVGTVQRYCLSLLYSDTFKCRPVHCLDFLTPSTWSGLRLPGTEERSLRHVISKYSCMFLFDYLGIFDTRTRLLYLSSDKLIKFSWPRKYCRTRFGIVDSSVVFCHNCFQKLHPYIFLHTDQSSSIFICVYRLKQHFERSLNRSFADFAYWRWTLSESLLAINFNVVCGKCLRVGLTTIPPPSSWTCKVNVRLSGWKYPPWPGSQHLTRILQK